MDDRLTAEILATCDSLGYADKDKYYKDVSCLECVKDLLLYLRRDDDDHSVRRLLGKTQVVQRDLLPLLKHYSEDLELSDVVLRLVMTLTCPALLLYRQEVPKNKKYLSYYLEIEQYLRNYKAAFVDKLLWKRLTDRLRYLLNLEWDKCMESDKQTLERILILIRDVLTIQSDAADEKRTDDENSLHDRVVMVMHLSGIEDLLLYVASSETTQEYCLHALEIISVMLREQTGEQLAKTQLTRNEEDKVKDERELLRIREKEAVLRNIQVKKLSTRHSRFGGTFSVRDMKAPSGRDLLCHKPISSTADLSLDSTKKTKRTASNRMPMKEDDPTRRSTVAVRIILKEFCAEFLDGAYNSLMRVVKDSINRGSTAEHDESYYLWAIKFFMEFNRHHSFRVKYVSETMSVSVFHYVQTLMDNYHAMMVTDKEKIQQWSKRAHMALNAYQELLYTLLWMDKFGNESVKESSRVLKSNIFYLPEYRELCFGLLNTYDPVKLSKLYLKDLIETNHLFLKMLEDSSSAARRIIIKTKGKRKKNTKNSKKSKKSRRGTVKNLEELEEFWTTVSEEISALISPDGQMGEENDGLENVNVIPFDAASDIPIDEQKGTALERIAVFLHTGKYKAAAVLLRASREVWPEFTEEFGEPGMDASDEMLVLKSIFLEKASSTAVSSALREIEEAPSDEDPEENEDEEFEEEEEEVRVTSKEQEFDFFGFVLKYATPKIVCNYANLFKDWESLKPFTLHCIMKMFHRFIFQMDYPALICQASIFRTFQRILQIADRQPDLKEVSKFFYHFWPKFVKLCENKTMFVEILFWKTSKEALEIQDGGFGSHLGTASTKTKSSKFSWTTEEDNEFVLLAEEYAALPDEAKRATKMVEWIQERWTWQPKSKKMMMNKLVEKGLTDSVVKSRRPPKTWGDEEIERLKELYNEFKESPDIMSNILDKMEIKRSRNSVIKKMIEIELVRDKSEVRKKRVRGQRSRKRNQVDRPESDTEGEHPDRPPRSRSSSVSSGSGSDSSRNDSESEDSDKENGATQNSFTSPIDATKSLQFGKELVAEGLIGPLRWIMQSLQYFLDDLCDEPDSDENVPLVPIGSDCISAISKSNMKAFLKSLGLQTPGIQESFWRIPGSWGQADVKSRIETLKKIMTAEAVQTSSVINRIDDDSSNEAPNSHVISAKPSDTEVRKSADEKIGTSQENRDSAKHPKSHIESDSDSSSSSSSSSSQGSKASLSQGSGIKNAKTSGKKNRITSDTDASDQDSSKIYETNLPHQEPPVNGRKNRSRIVVESDSENEDSSRIMELDKSPEKLLRPSIIDSDDDEENKTTKKGKSKASLRIMDSSDED